MNDEPAFQLPVPAAVPCGLPGALYHAVRMAWAAGRAEGDPEYPPLRREVEQLARAARARDVPASDVLRTLDAVCRRHLGGDDALDWDHVRAWVGGVGIRAYYRDD